MGIIINEYIWYTEIRTLWKFELIEIYYYQSTKFKCCFKNIQFILEKDFIKKESTKNVLQLSFAHLHIPLVHLIEIALKRKFFFRIQLWYISNVSVVAKEDYRRISIPN